MNKWICSIIVCAIALGAHGEMKAGTCTLKEGSPFDEDIFTVEVGKQVKGTCKFYIDDFFGKKIINAGIEIKNTSDTNMHCQYYVAFFDKSGDLLGCAAQGTFGEEGLATGESTQFGSCLIPLPKGIHEQAVAYKITFYEGDQQIGMQLETSN